jgi:hypothetical protein
MRSFCVFLVLVVASCGVPSVEGDPDSRTPLGDSSVVNDPNEPAELSGTTKAHNDARATEGIVPLVWDSELAAVSVAWAAQCVDVEFPEGLVDHNDSRSDDYPGYVGENIYASSGGATGPAAVASWMGEKQFYDYDANECADEEICGHYTQVMWAKSLRLGCALQNCPSLKYSSTIVCNYSPGGNFSIGPPLPFPPRCRRYDRTRRRP